VRSSKFFTDCLFEVTALLIALRTGAPTRAPITAERSIHAQSIAARNGLAPPSRARRVGRMAMAAPRIGKRTTPSSVFQTAVDRI
jgi:hypothetical protein